MQGRIFAYRPSVLRTVTFRLLYPPPCGVVIGAFRKTLVRRSDSQASAGIPDVCPCRYALSPISNLFDVQRGTRRLQHVQRGRHDFRANSVSTSDGDGRLVRHSASPGSSRQRKTAGHGFGRKTQDGSHNRLGGKTNRRPLPASLETVEAQSVATYPSPPQEPRAERHSGGSPKLPADGLRTHPTLGGDGSRLPLAGKPAIFQSARSRAARTDSCPDGSPFRTYSADRPSWAGGFSSRAITAAARQGDTSQHERNEPRIQASVVTRPTENRPEFRRHTVD